VKSVRLVISGRVQGVGFRDWMVAAANARGVSGWVRNLGGAQVEACVQGDGVGVDAIIALCRKGPSYAQVDDITVEQIEAGPMTRFEWRQSV
jgi:acylphosphatase